MGELSEDSSNVVQLIMDAYNVRGWAWASAGTGAPEGGPQALRNRALALAHVCRAEASGLHRARSPARGQEGKEGSLSCYLMPRAVLAHLPFAISLTPLNPCWLTIIAPIL